MKEIITNLKRLIVDEEAASIVEYVVVIGTGLVVGAAVTKFLTTQFSDGGTAQTNLATAIGAATSSAVK